MLDIAFICALSSKRLKRAPYTLVVLDYLFLDCIFLLTRLSYIALPTCLKGGCVVVHVCV